MTISRYFRSIAGLFGLLVLTACGVAPEERAPVDPVQVEELRMQIMGLGPDIDPDEAARAARIAFQHTRDLAIAYQITDPPLIHNSKVNMGLRPRGLCWHWAEDMQTRLEAEGFETLVMHRAIANSQNAFRIEHSTAIVSASGDDFMAGIVLDPWRKGGVLTHVRTATDPDYSWDPQAEVLARKRARILAATGR